MKTIISTILFFCFCVNCHGQDLRNYMVKKGIIKEADQILIIPDYHINQALEFAINDRSTILNSDIIIPIAFLQEFEFISLSALKEKIVFIVGKTKPIYRKGNLYFMQITKKLEMKKYLEFYKFIRKHENYKQNTLFFTTNKYNCTFIVLDNKLYIQPDWNPKLIKPAQQIVDCCWNTLVAPKATNLKPKK